MAFGLLLLATTAQGLVLSPAAAHGLVLSPALRAAVPATVRHEPVRSDIIDEAVSVVTFAPQPLWLLMIAAPRARFTQEIMGPIGPLLALSLIHFLIVVTAASQPGGTEPIALFGDVFDPAKSQLDGMVRLFEVRAFVAEEWPHVLIWDLLAGRMIWLDGLARGFPAKLLAPSLLLCNGIGPPGLLLHVAISLLSGRGLPLMGWSETGLERLPRLHDDEA